MLAELGVDDVPLVGIAKGPDRDAGRETFFMPGRDAVQAAAARSGALFRRSACATRPTASPSARTAPRRKRDMREAGLQEIAGIGPTRKRALLHHFGTLKAIERASLDGPLPRSPASAPRRRGASTTSSTRERHERRIARSMRGSSAVDAARPACAMGSVGAAHGAMVRP